MKPVKLPRPPDQGPGPPVTEGGGPIGDAPTEGGTGKEPLIGGDVPAGVAPAALPIMSISGMPVTPPEMALPRVVSPAGVPGARACLSAAVGVKADAIIDSGLAMRASLDVQGERVVITTLRRERIVLANKRRLSGAFTPSHFVWDDWIGEGKGEGVAEVW